MRLKTYQKTAVDKLLFQAKKLLDKPGEKICVFKSPTGSGKTIMVADFLQQFSREYTGDKQFSFIWISSHDLHSQSKEKLENYLSESRYTFSYLEEVQRSTFEENEIVFVNWHSLTKKNREGEWSNVLMRDNEQDKNLPTFIRNTKEQDREIILIVDESHHHYWSDQSQELVKDVIAPKLSIEVSATPSILPSAEDMATGDAGFIVVPFGDVVAEGMIKSETIINKEIGEYKDLSDSADEAILDASLQQQSILKAEYGKEDSKVNPLILIQLPSQSKSTSALDKTKLEQVKTYLAEKHDITVDNGRLAIWLSKEKENLEGIERVDNKVDVLIFKQAIALGWDCPRAQILVMFRDIKSVTFEIQTVGRILRMPEVKHYDSEVLNSAYVYTNLEDIKIKQDEGSQSFFNVSPSHRESSYEPIQLPSVYLSRVDYGDLTLAFRKLFIEEANKRFGITSQDIGDSAYKKADVDLELYPEELTKPIIANAVIDNVDGARDVVGELVEFSVPMDDLKYKFELFAKVASLPFAPVRSHTKVQQAIYDWFDSYLGYKDKSRAEIQRVVVCSDVNQKIFLEIIESAKARFREVRKTEIQAKERKKVYEWDVPNIDYYNENYERVSLANHVMNPCYLSKVRSGQEKEFEKILSESDQVTWWYKNGESKEMYFAIAYVHPDDDLEHAFYPDYIVQKKDGSVGIFDTKSGFTAQSAETAAKSDALQQYIKENKSKNLFGGIVEFDKTGGHVFTGAEYTHDKSNEHWKILDL
jgi:type III restriction enzyme